WEGTRRPEIRIVFPVTLRMRTSRGSLHLERADIDPVVDHPWKTGAALVEIRRRSKARVAHVDGRAAGQQRMGKGRAAVVLQGAEQRIGAVLVTGLVQERAGVIAAQVVAE